METEIAKLFLGKKVFLRINSSGRELVYTARVLRVTENNIMFKDKFGYLHSFKLVEVKSIEEVSE